MLCGSFELNPAAALCYVMRHMVRSALWRFLSPLIVILALSTYGAAANTPAVLGTNWTSADLDGDHKPDLAQGHSIAHHGNHLYQVDLTLTSGQRTGSFTFSNPKELDLEINAVDVDGDNDLDLVISGRFLGDPIGVWINDGAGSFSKSSSEAYPSFDKPTLSSSDSCPLSQAAETRPSQRDLSTPETGAFVRAPQCISKITAHISTDPVFQVQYDSHLLRAPPSTL
jgi:hypothetical protein